jgi:hypothetical protein
MKTQNDASQKHIVEQLDFGPRTTKRVTWEAWEFTVIGPNLVEVTNASYGFQKDDHTYTVGVEERDGVALPAECNCPADMHRDPDCKHKVALATVGGPTVLNAALNVAEPAPSTDTKPNTVADKLRPDGGATPEICPNGNERCDGPTGEAFPCFDCYDVEEGR